jgi:hypothetical protein
VELGCDWGDFAPVVSARFGHQSVAGSERASLASTGRMTDV